MHDMAKCKLLFCRYSDDCVAQHYSLAVCGSDTGDFSVRPEWGSFSVNNLFQTLVNSYTHSNWQHTLLNMLCFLFAGIYLERKKAASLFCCLWR